MSVRVRFAPSPTGSLHPGGLRTALFNYLFAKQHKGSFVLRIEDTDQGRHIEPSLTPLLKNLSWLGLKWDEGLFLKEEQESSKTSYFSKGSFKPYRQSERLSIYREKALQLIKESHAYYCFMTEEEEAEQKASCIKKGLPYRVLSPYRDYPLAKAEKRIQQERAKPCIRFKTAHQSQPYQFQDLIRGNICFPADSLGDFILIRSDGFPVYNFSCAVDDSLMQISHVLRAEEHLSNTLRQRLIQKALNLPSPQMAHLSIILGKDRKKLSKRSAAQSLDAYKREGFLPSALINFTALLGWNPGTEQEFFTKEELIQSFDIQRLNPASACFDEDKLLWLNAQHIKALSEEELLEALRPFLNPSLLMEASSRVKSLIPPLRSGFKSLKQAGETLALFSEEGFVLQSSALSILNQPESRSLIEHWLNFLQEKERESEKEHLDMEDLRLFQTRLKESAQGIKAKGREFFMPLRCALMGQPEGLEIKILISLLRLSDMIKRAKLALNQQKLVIN